MIFNYQIIIEYLGENFVGWQSQKNGKSIQSTIEKALSKTLKKKFELLVQAELMQVLMLSVKAPIFILIKKLRIFINFCHLLIFFLAKIRFQF